MTDFKFIAKPLEWLLCPFEHLSLIYMVTAFSQSEFLIILSHSVWRPLNVSPGGMHMLSTHFMQKRDSIFLPLWPLPVSKLWLFLLFFSLSPLALLFGCTDFFFFFYQVCLQALFWQLERLNIYFCIHLACFHVLLWNRVYAVFCSSESFPLMCVECLILISLQETEK